MKRALPSTKMIKDRPLRKGSDFDICCKVNAYYMCTAVHIGFRRNSMNMVCRLQKYILNYASGITGKLIICGCYAKNYMIIYRINCRVKYV